MADAGDDLLKAKSESREILPGVRVYPKSGGSCARRRHGFSWIMPGRRFHATAGSWLRYRGQLTSRDVPTSRFSRIPGQVDWAKVHVFWSDERAVPPEHAESNYGMARANCFFAYLFRRQTFTAWKPRNEYRPCGA